MKNYFLDIYYIHKRAILLLLFRCTHLENPGTREDEWRRESGTIPTWTTRTNYPFKTLGIQTYLGGLFLLQRFFSINSRTHLAKTI